MLSREDRNTNAAYLTRKYEGYSESNLWLAVNKTSNMKKNKYILKLLLNILTARIEALFALENKFLYACVKEVCCL
jgi:hypothetical protein